MRILLQPLQKNNLWKRPIKNAGVLLIGRGTQAVLSLVYLALAARALGPTDFGYLVMIHGLALTAAQLVRFQSWQAILSFGAKALDKNDTPRFQDLLLFCVFIDLISSLTGFIIIQLGMDWLSSLLHIPEELMQFTRIYMIGMLFLIMGSVSEGVMRLFDRHDLISIQTTIEPVIRFGGALYLFFYDGSLIEFMYVWFAGMIASRIGGMILSYALLRSKNMLSGMRPNQSILKGPEKGIWKFVIGTSITTSLNINNHQLATVLAGWLLGPAGAGLYRVGQQISNVLSKPVSKLLIPAIYTDMALFSASGDKEKSKDVSIQTAILAFTAALAVFGILVAFGSQIITLFAGEDYAASYKVMVLLCIAALLNILSFPLEPMLISAQKVKETVFTNLTAIVLYLAGFYALSIHFGLIGAGFAMVIYAATVTIMLWLFSMQYLASDKDKNA